MMICVILGGIETSLADEPVEWRTIKIAQLWGDNKSDRGFLLYTSGDDKTGAAFRCEEGKLFAFLAVKPADFRGIIQKRSPSPSDREVRFALGDNAELKEKWVQMFSGKIYMVREVSTTLEIFQAVASGVTITFTRKYGKTVSIPIPALEKNISSHFLERCNLKKPYLPEIS